VLGPYQWSADPGAATEAPVCTIGSGDSATGLRSDSTAAAEKIGGRVDFDAGSDGHHIAHQARGRARARSEPIASGGAR
jgi:hypothetical protein